MNRRKFLTTTSSCGAHVLALATFAPSLMRQALAAKPSAEISVEEKWGRLEKIDDGVWALVSTPFTTKDFTTVCNGGIIAGDQGVLAVESFMTPKGATWLAEQAERLTGKWPTDIVSTHYHADHTAGHLGYFAGNNKPRVWLTEATQASAEQSFADRNLSDNQFQEVARIETVGETDIDLGNRKVRLVPRSGHTASDVTVELVDPKIVWTGDLFFNRMFPNYSDATPTRLNQYVDALVKSDDIIFVPGHGPVADYKALKKYQEFLTFIQESATRSFEAGKPVEEETKDYQLPQQFADWVVWSPENAKKAYAAWYRELQQRL